jgi:hypothetical protein
MKTATKFEGAALTLYSIERTEILGELSDASWVEESSDMGTNYVLAGNASEGTVDTLLQIIQLGVAWVAYDFETSGQLYHGQAMLLQPTASPAGAGATIQVESPDAPRVTEEVGVSGVTS